MMKKQFNLGWLAAGLLLVAGPAFAGEIWTIDDAHSSAHFKVRHLMITNVTGQLTGITGTFDSDSKDITKLKVDASIDAKTINTHNEKRDEHLKNADFLEVEKHPKITFKSKKVTKDKGTKFKVMGDLTIRGVTKEVTLNSDGFTNPVKDPWGNTKRGFAATTKLNRKDFGITWNKAMDGGGVVVSDEIDVTLEVELQKKDSAS